MQLVLVRHAEPLLVEAGAGPADPPLSEKGREQAAAVAEFLKHEQIDAVVYSPMRRTAETAACIAAAIGVEPVSDEGFIEFGCEDDSYYSVEELKARNDPRWEVIARGEIFGVDPVKYQQTLVDAAETWISAYPGGRVVIVSHTGAINCYMARVAGISKMLWIPPKFASVSRVTAGRDGRRSITSVNETAHLSCVGTSQ